MPTPGFAALGAAQYVSLTTFRKSGEGVATAVWIAPYGDDLVAITIENSGKVKRARNNPRVTLAPCGMTGKVKAGSTEVTGTVEVIADEDAMRPAIDALRAKYGWQFRMSFGPEGKPKRPEASRVILRISPV